MSKTITQNNNDIIVTYQGQDPQGDEGEQGLVSELADIAINVKSFGATGNGTTDDTIAIQNAINSLPNGGLVLVPEGKYLITSLNIPVGVSLVGHYTFNPMKTGGSWFYCTNTNNPALTLNGNQKVEGIAFYYPNQAWDSTNSKPKYAYPASLYVNTDAKRVTIRDVFFLNAYTGIDAYRHHEILVLENVQGYCIYQGVIMDFSTDNDRWNIVHFNYNTLAVTSDPNANNYGQWTRTNGTAFKIARADWIVLHDCFCWGYRTAFYFTSSANGALSGGHMVSCGADACGICINQDAGWGLNVIDCFFTHFNNFADNTAMDDFALSFSGSNDILVQGCRFWGLDRQGIWNNASYAKIVNTFFGDYGAKAVTNNADYRAIVSNNGLTIVEGNQFLGNSRSRVYGVLAQHPNTGAIIHRNNTYRDYVQTGFETTATTANISTGGNVYKNCSTGKYINPNSTNVKDTGDDLSLS